MKNSSLINIEQIKECGIFTDFDISFAQFIYSLSDKKPLELFFAALLLSHDSSEGHVCLDLDTIQNTHLSEYNLNASTYLSPVNQWPNILISCSVVNKPGDFCPLILDGKLLYLHKYCQYETYIAERLNTLASDTIDITDPERLLKLLDQYFPQAQEDTNWQRTAACIAATKRLCIITGGPGTGKTTAVVRILALLIELAQNNTMRIALAAPTGKAAARMEEAVQLAKSSLNNYESIIDKMPTSAATIHRLLGTIPNSHNFRHGPDNPLPVDIAVVDEASMIDLSLMAKFLGALPTQSRLILLGDRDQLASVQAGSVLGDICNNEYISVFSHSFRNTIKPFVSINPSEKNLPHTAPALTDCIFGLRKTYRFKGIIAECCNAVKCGDEKTVFACINKSDSDLVSWTELPQDKSLSKAIKEDIIHSWLAYLEAESLNDMFTVFNDFRTLCVLRSGPFGVETVNILIENILAETGLLFPTSQWYAKQPIMITKNDYQLNLYNGDTGIIAPDPASDGKLKAWFPALKTEKKQAFRSFSPSRLPTNETAFAITVHKSQGAEYNSILLLLPNSDTPILTRELIYTGITRARQRISIYGKESIFKLGVERRIDRKSGLREKLWNKI